MSDSPAGEHTPLPWHPDPAVRRRRKYSELLKVPDPETPAQLAVWVRALQAWLDRRHEYLGYTDVGRSVLAGPDVDDYVVDAWYYLRTIAGPRSHPPEPATPLTTAAARAALDGVVNWCAGQTPPAETEAAGAPGPAAVLEAARRALEEIDILAPPIPNPAVRPTDLKRGGFRVIVARVWDVARRTALRGELSHPPPMPESVDDAIAARRAIDVILTTYGGTVTTRARGKAKGRRATVSSRMMDEYQRDPGKLAWTVEKWADYLGCSTGAVGKSGAWRAIMTTRAKQGRELAEQASRSLPKNDGRKRMKTAEK